MSMYEGPSKATTIEDYYSDEERSYHPSSTFHVRKRNSNQRPRPYHYQPTPFDENQIDEINQRMFAMAMEDEYHERLSRPVSHRSSYDHEFHGPYYPGYQQDYYGPPMPNYWPDHRPFNRRNHQEEEPYRPFNRRNHQEEEPYLPFNRRNHQEEEPYLPFNRRNHQEEEPYRRNSLRRPSRTEPNSPYFPRAYSVPNSPHNTDSEDDRPTRSNSIHSLHEPFQTSPPFQTPPFQTPSSPLVPIPNMMMPIMPQPNLMPQPNILSQSNLMTPPMISPWINPSILPAFNPGLFQLMPDVLFPTTETTTEPEPTQLPKEAPTFSIPVQAKPNKKQEKLAREYQKLQTFYCWRPANDPTANFESFSIPNQKTIKRKIQKNQLNKILLQKEKKLPGEIIIDLITRRGCSVGGQNQNNVVYLDIKEEHYDNISGHFIFNSNSEKDK